MGSERRIIQSPKFTPAPEFVALCKMCKYSTEQPQREERFTSAIPPVKTKCSGYMSDGHKKCQHDVVV